MAREGARPGGEAPAGAQVEARRALAEEFLTWLWFRCESGGELELDQGRKVSVAVDDDLLLRGEQGKGGPEGVLRRGSPTVSREAGAALRSGKRLARARLVLASGEREWSFVLDAGPWNLTGIRCAKPEGKGRAGDVETMESFEELALLVDGLFLHFLSERLSDRFDRARLAMRRWAARK